MTGGCDSGSSSPFVFSVLSGAGKSIEGRYRGALALVGHGLGVVNGRVKLRVPLAVCITERS